MILLSAWPTLPEIEAAIEKNVRFFVDLDLAGDREKQAAQIALAAKEVLRLFQAYQR